MTPTFKFIVPQPNASDEQVMRTMRLNSLGSLYYFIKIALRRSRLVMHLHLPMCTDLEKEHLKELYEMPRDHFKSTTCTEGRPMWRALPFTAQDEDDFFTLGYSEEFIRWMKYIHDPNIRQLLVSENKENAAKLGTRIRNHFESNATYRTLFPETLPDTSCTWGTYSLHVKRMKNQFDSKFAHGEGTFDFIGVGGALQSRHYNGGITEDDMVGRKAIESVSVMNKTIDYHQLIVGAFDDEDPDHEADELVVGNRWGFNDLNSHVREHEPWFKITSHSALGGCCDRHPEGIPIFPEEFSIGKLAGIKKRQGAYKFSCQYLNNPIAPEDADFQAHWLNYFSTYKDNVGRLVIKHEVRDGIVRADTYVNSLGVAITCDPNHSGNQAQNRCRHAITVWGSDGEDYYLLDYWAVAASYYTLFERLFEKAAQWKQHKVGFETVAAQKYAAYHIETMNKEKLWHIKIHPLKGEVDLEDGTMSKNKEWRIRNVISPIAERGNMWIQRHHNDFYGEFVSFPQGKYKDILDASAYAPQMLRRAVKPEVAMMQKHRNLMGAKLVNQPYSLRVH